MTDGEERLQVSQQPSPPSLGERRSDATIHELFEVQARRTPEALAVEGAGQRLTYAALDARANQLAWHLRGLGVGPDRPVALLLDRTPDLAVAMLGVLKAGGCYVPLDPAYPEERIAFLVRDTGAAVVLTQSHLLRKLPSHPQVRCLDTDAARFAGEPRMAPPSTAAPETLAYVIYTSGSTGTPKGVMVPHRGIGNLVAWHNATYRLGPGDRCAPVAGLAFDATVWEVWPALLAGATLVLPDEATRLHPGELQAWLLAQGITVTFVPTPIAELLLDLPWGDQTPLRALLTGGDRLVRVPAALPFALVNHYGPTESTVVSTAGEVPLGRLQGKAPSIGKPIHHLQVRILDAELREVPAGEAGELCVAGASLARGYLGRPDLTAERFIPDAWADGGRSYRTGDLARITQDGSFEFLGRIDHQVKIRGHRIELGEVEAALVQVDGVRQAVVLVREDAPGVKRLVAYVVGNNGDAPTPQAMRETLARRLPDFMVPGAYVFLHSLPLTPNGKVDRAALPAPDGTLSATPYEAPRTPAEQALARIWTEVLHAGPVGVHDNFLELGGDSILAFQVVSKAHKLGMRLSPGQLLRHQTIAELVGVLGEAGLVEAEQGPVLGAVPLTPIQAWYADCDLEDFQQSLLLLAPEDVDAAALRTALQALVAHHDALRLRLRRRGDAWEQTCALPGASVPFEVIDLRSEPAATRQAAMEACLARVRADLRADHEPLLRAALVDLGSAKQLFLTIHHLAVDGVSWRVLAEDLGSAYAQALRGAPVQLPAKTTSFQAWARKLQEHASQGLEAEAATWRAAVREAAPLPADFPGGANSVASACTLRLEVDEATTRSLLHDAHRAYRTRVNDLLLAALGQAMVRWTGRSRVLVDWEGHGREEDLVQGVDLSRTVGWFTALYPVSLDLPAPRDTAACVRAAKERLRAVPGKGLGFGVLRFMGTEEVREALAALPRPEVVFNYLGQFEAPEAGAFRPLAEMMGKDAGVRGTRPWVLEVNCSVASGRLVVDLTYSSNLHREASVRALGGSFASALREVVAHCTTPGVGGATPSDFPFVGLEQGALDGLLAGRQVEDLLPTTALQHGMLFHTLLEPASGAYFEQLDLRFEGALEPEAFRAAWQHVVARHAALRTSFAWQGLEAPVQVVHRAVEVPVAFEDLRSLGAEQQEARILAHIQEEQRRGFDLAEAPLLRITVFRTGVATRRLVWSFHHMVLDGWGMAVALREVFQAYEAFAEGHTPALPRAPALRAYAAWMQGQDLGAAERHWRDLLRGFAAPTPLTVDRPQGAPPSWPPPSVERRLSATTTQALHAVARSHHLTLSALLEGAWGLLLSRYGGEADVVFGATVAGRPADLPGSEALVGVFINTLPVRVRIDEAQSAVAWIRGIQEQHADLGRFEATPLNQVQRWSGLQPGAQLFDSIVVVENYPLSFETLDEGAEAPGLAGSLRMRAARVHEATNFGLTVVVGTGERLLTRVLYDPRRFDAATVERLLGHYHTLLAQLAAHPEEPLGSLDPLPAGERRLVTEGWNDTVASYPRSTIQACFATQARATPDAVAVAFEDQELSYAALDRRANQVAHHLRGLGVQRGDLVGLCVERSLDLVVALLGVLKAGAAYVPMDPSYPQERLAFMLQDTAAPVLVVQSHLRDRLPAHEARVLDLDADAALVARHPTHDPGVQGGPEDVAYVEYTSGSTGKPKGVVVPHRGVLRLVLGQDYLTITPDDVFLQFAPVSFDASTLEVWGPLLNGAKLVVAPPREHSLEELGALVRDRGITTLWLTAPLFHLMVQEQPEALRGVRQLLAGGDALSVPHVRRALEVLPGTQVINGYGPTENTTFTTCHTVPRDAALQGSVPIGRPIANTTCYVVDGRMRPCPIGVPGELLIGGDGLALGYHNNPHLTLEKFVPDPFGATPGQRLYRTGDRVRRLPDGTLEFLGRIDFQVKVRGFRIELGEVEAALRNHHDVRDAVVVAREDAPGDKRLVAYVVGRNGDLDPAALRTFLGERLPDHMLPSATVVLGAFPLSPNGKVDRKALPAPELGRDAAMAFVAPRTPTEARMAEVWAALLKVPKVGAEDDFFELGGDSLLATQLASRLRQAFGVEVPLRSLLEARTVAALAAEVDARIAAQARAPAMPVAPIQRVARAAIDPAKLGRKPGGGR